MKYSELESSRSHGSSVEESSMSSKLSKKNKSDDSSLSNDSLNEHDLFFESHEIYTHNH